MRLISPSSFIKLILSFAGLVGILSPVSLHADATAQNFYGLNAHLTMHADYQAEIDDIIASGAKWVRFGPPWSSMETSSGYYEPTYMARLDDVVNRLTSKGVNIIWVLAYTPQWASSMPGATDFNRYRPTLWSSWESYVQTITARYNNKIFYWEVWNEPDLAGFWKSSLADYNDLLQKASVKIRAANVNNKVVIGGLALSNGTTDVYGLGTFFDNLLGYTGAADSFDIINYHAYGESSHWFELYNGMQTVIQSRGIQSKKIWLTETGATSNGDPTKESFKADRVDQTFLTHAGMPGVERVFWYVNRNIPAQTPARPSEENFGLTATNRTPMKAMAYYQASGGALADFYLQKNYPTQSPTLRTLYYVPTTTGDGAAVVDYTTDGSVKKIPMGTYMYFQVNDNWIYDSNSGLDNDVTVDVTYLDTGTGNFALQYDGTTNAYTPLSKALGNTGAWVTTSFTLNNVKFANRENHASDLRLYAQGADLIVSRVVMRRPMNKASVVLGTAQKMRLLFHEVDDVSTSSGYAPVATMGGEECRSVSVGTKYIHFRLCDGLAKVGNPNVTFGIRFWDGGTDSLLLRYNAVGNPTKGIVIAKTNTNAWRYVQVAVDDAAFNNNNSYNADFFIGNYGDGVEYINRVDVTLRRISAVLGGIDRFRLINHPLDTNASGIGYAPWTTMGGTSCLQIQNNTKALYFQVADGLANISTTNVTFGVRYWDAGTDSILIRYNAIENANKGAPLITKTNTNTWKYSEVTVTDAAFNSLLSYAADFSIGNAGDGSVEYISAVDVKVP